VEAIFVKKNAPVKKVHGQRWKRGGGKCGKEGGELDKGKWGLRETVP